MEFLTTFLNLGVESYARGGLDCACGRTHRIGTEIIVESGAVKRVGEVIERAVGRFIKIAVLSDNIVWELVGKSIEQRLLESDYRCVRHIYKAKVMPSVNNADAIRELITEDTKLILGIGGGTISDIVKFNAAKFKLPSVFVATSPSQCGYLSLAACLTNQGLPETFIVKAHDALVCDLDIIANAPQQLFASGFGELASACVALLDWQTARLMKEEAYCGETVKVLRDILSNTEEISRGLLENEPNAKARLFQETLRLSAICQATESSRLINSSANQCGAVVSLLKERQNLAARLQGENTFLFAKVLMRIYLAFLKNHTLHALPPPDNVLRLERISRIFSVEEVVTAAKLSPLLDAESYQLCCHKIQEYREDLLALANEAEQVLNRLTKPFSRLYADAGFWMSRYLSSDDIRTVISLAPDMNARYTFLSFLKDIGYLEQFMSAE